MTIATNQECLKTISMQYHTDCLSVSLCTYDTINYFRQKERNGRFFYYRVSSLAQYSNCILEMAVQNSSCVLKFGRLHKFLKAHYSMCKSPSNPDFKSGTSLDMSIAIFWVTVWRWFAIDFWDFCFTFQLIQQAQ